MLTSKDQGRRQPARSGTGSSLTASLPAFFLILGLGLCVALGLGAWRYQRVRANQSWLDQCQADYEWYCQLSAFRHHLWPRLQNSLARVTGLAAVSDVYRVSLSGTLPDESLERLHQLRHVDQLDLASDAASDKTLSKIAQLRQLRSLSLTGQHFTFEGLLELRRLSNLRELVLSDMPLTMAELAVLETAVPQANLTYNRQASSVAYQRKVAMRFPTLYRPKSETQVSFEPLLGSTPSPQDAIESKHDQPSTLSDI